jgi:ketopantoate reductase
MRIVVMGAGGVGGYFGARLAHAGHDVTFIARGKHLEAMQQKGLTLKSPLGDAVVKVKAVGAAAKAGPADIVLFAVKLWDTESAARELHPAVERGGHVIPFQNGVESVARIGAGRKRGVKLADDLVAKTLAQADTFAPEMRASMAADLEAGGKLEAPWLSGAVARMAREAGLEGPVNRAVYAALKPFVNGSAGKAA